MEYKDINAIITEEKKYKENDKIITMITDSLGKISVLAKGVSKMNSGIKALSLYSLLKVDLKSLDEDFYIVTSAEKVINFSNITKDLEIQSYVQYILQLSKDLFLPGEPFPELFRLLVNTIFLFDKNDREKELLKCIFELRALTLSGYGIEASSCAECGNENISYINIYDGECLCKGCGEKTGGRPICATNVKVVNHICSCDEKKLFSFKIGMPTIRELSFITTNYVKICMDKEYSSLKFLRSIQKGLKDAKGN